MSARPPAAAAAARRERFAAVALGAALAVHLAVALRRRAIAPGDFDLCRELGRRFLAGEPLYAGGLHYPYPPAAALFFAPLALVPAPLAFALRYGAAVLALALTLRGLGTPGPGPPRARTTTALVALALGAHYVIRDLDDGGAHLLLLGLVVLGFALHGRGRSVAAGLSLGLAAAVKAPLALVLPYLAWKRERRATAAMLGGLLLWTALPAARMGAGPWLDHERQWVRVAAASALGAPIAGADESERRPQNQSLRRVVERSAEPLVGSPAARAAGLAASLALLFGVAAWTRSRGNASDRLEQAAVLVASLLLSPVTWLQHLVLALPALHAMAAATRAPVRDRVLDTLTAVYALLALGLNREVLGRELYVALLGAGLHAAAMLLVLAALARIRRAAPAA